MRTKTGDAQPGELTTRRLATVRSHPALTRLAELAARLTGAPWAQVSLGADSQAVAAAAGSDVSVTGAEVPLAAALCAAAATSAGPLVVADAAADERVASLPPVRSGPVRSCLGVPLRGQDGTVLGALCVFGPEPRTWRASDVALLDDLAVAAVTELELSALAVQYEASRLRWQLSIEAAGIGSYDWDLLTGELEWDDRLLEMFGYDRAGFGGRIEAFYERVHPEDLPRVTRALEAAIAACGEFEAEYRVELPGVGTRWIFARGRALGDESGRAVRLLGAAYDTTARKDTDTRLARVLETMSVGYASYDRQWLITYVNAEAERLIGMSREDVLGRNVWELFPAAVGSPIEEHYREAVATGQPVSFDAHYPDPLNAWYEIRATPTPEGLSVYFLDVTARRVAQEEAEDARRAAEDARGEAEAAREGAERTAQRMQLLSGVNEALAATVGLEEAVGRLARLVVPGLAQWCIVSAVDDRAGEDSGRGMRDLGWWHEDPALREVLERYASLRLPALAEDAPARRALRSGQPVLVREAAVQAIGSALHSAEARALLAELAPRSVLFLPLHAGGRVLGLLSLFSSDPERHATDAVVGTGLDVAARAGLALDNARLYTQQQRLAEGLQRSMLTSPPEPDHLQIVVRYRPAARAAQVGGDWYDAFLQPDGGTVLVIGDVMGHDVDAAAAMGQIRSLLRGIGYSSGGTPAAVLSSLDATMQGLGVETTATALVARVEQTAAEEREGLTRLRWSNAGHPPPVLVSPEGTVTVLDGRHPGLLLGVAPEFPRADSELAVERGSTVLLYTDGLIERRGQSLDEGLERLVGVLADLAGADLDGLCDGILERMLPASLDDDVALVAVRLHPQDRPRPPEAGPATH
ncbi:SpoIIE family protein phosphatase [Kineococcus xinjiangensis]|uniref:SpoIIE family protein phosphatase n=1 Tax=Kineococcus xinjiangensis TaxID=512762 RepID=UPI001FE41804|nr:SpoIIE family protein phosphatase [Kineococcus xinjiangensis]